MSLNNPPISHTKRAGSLRDKVVSKPTHTETLRQRLGEERVKAEARAFATSSGIARDGTPAQKREDAKAMRQLLQDGSLTAPILQGSDPRYDAQGNRKRPSRGR